MRVNSTRLSGLSCVYSRPPQPVSPGPAYLVRIVTSQNRRVNGREYAGLVNPEPNASERGKLGAAGADQLLLGGSDDTPAAYKALVEEYYRALARDRKK